MVARGLSNAESASTVEDARGGGCFARCINMAAARALFHTTGMLLLLLLIVFLWQSTAATRICNSYGYYCHNATHYINCKPPESGGDGGGAAEEGAHECPRGGLCADNIPARCQSADTDCGSRDHVCLNATHFQLCVETSMGTMLRMGDVENCGPFMQCSEDVSVICVENDWSPLAETLSGTRDQTCNDFGYMCVNSTHFATCVNKQMTNVVDRCPQGQWCSSNLSSICTDSSHESCGVLGHICLNDTHFETCIQDASGNLRTTGQIDSCQGGTACNELSLTICDYPLSKETIEIYDWGSEKRDSEKEMEKQWHVEETTIHAQVVIISPHNSFDQVTLIRNNSDMNNKTKLTQFEFNNNDGVRTLRTSTSYPPTTSRIDSVSTDIGNISNTETDILKEKGVFIHSSAESPVQMISSPRILKNITLQMSEGSNLYLNKTTDGDLSNTGEITTTIAPTINNIVKVTVKPNATLNNNSNTETYNCLLEKLQHPNFSNTTKYPIIQKEQNNLRSVDTLDNIHISTATYNDVFHENVNSSINSEFKDIENLRETNNHDYGTTNIAEWGDRIEPEERTVNYTPVVNYTRNESKTLELSLSALQNDVAKSLEQYEEDSTPESLVFADSILKHEDISGVYSSETIGVHMTKELETLFETDIPYLHPSHHSKETVENIEYLEMPTNQNLTLLSKEYNDEVANIKDDEYSIAQTISIQTATEEIEIAENNSQNIIQCPHKGKFLHPNGNGSLFYCCVHTGTRFKAFTYACPPGSVFSSPSQKCTINEELFRYKYQEEIGEEVNRPTSAGYSCETAGRFPSSSGNCSLFYVCMPFRNTLIKRDFVCPSGSEFNPQQMKCTIPEKSNCSVTFRQFNITNVNFSNEFDSMINNHSIEKSIVEDIVTTEYSAYNSNALHFINDVEAEVSIDTTTVHSVLNDAVTTDPTASPTIYDIVDIDTRFNSGLGEGVGENTSGTTIANGNTDIDTRTVINSTNDEITATSTTKTAFTGRGIDTYTEPFTLVNIDKVTDDYNHLLTDGFTEMSNVLATSAATVTDISNDEDNDVLQNNLYLSDTSDQPSTTVSNDPTETDVYIIDAVHKVVTDFASIESTEVTTDVNKVFIDNSTKTYAQTKQLQSTTIASKNDATTINISITEDTYDTDPSVGFENIVGTTTKVDGISTVHNYVASIGTTSDDNSDAVATTTDINGNIAATATSIYDESRTTNIDDDTTATISTPKDLSSVVGNDETTEIKTTIGIESIVTTDAYFESTTQVVKNVFDTISPYHTRIYETTTPEVFVQVTDTISETTAQEIHSVTATVDDLITTYGITDAIGVTEHATTSATAERSVITHNYIKDEIIVEGENNDANFTDNISQYTESTVSTKRSVNMTRNEVEAIVDVRMVTLSEDIINNTIPSVFNDTTVATADINTIDLLRNTDTALNASAPDNISPITYNDLNTISTMKVDYSTFITPNNASRTTASPSSSSFGSISSTDSSPINIPSTSSSSTDISTSISSTTAVAITASSKITTPGTTAAPTVQATSSTTKSMNREVTSTPKPFTCYSSGKFANPADNRTYFICSPRFGGGFHVLYFTCPGRSEYFPSLEKCATVLWESGIATTSHAARLVRRSIHTATHEGVVEGRASPSGCHTPGYFPDHSKCSVYHMCARSASGRLDRWTLKCPIGSSFDPNMATCRQDFPCGTILTLHD